VRRASGDEARWRNVHTFSVQRLVCALLPVAIELPALATLALLMVALAVLIAYETVRFAEARDRIRHQVASEPPPA
jgi:hypothetical protein